MATLTRILITLCVGVAAILAWQSYGDAARQIIASSYPQAGWLAPRTAPIAYSAPGTTGLAAQATPSLDQHRLNAISLDLDAMRQTVDRIAVTQEQITRKVEKLTAGQERMLVESPILEVVMQANWRISSSMLLVPLITASAATTTLAAEFPKPVTQWTCAEFLSVDDKFKSIVVSWATTFAKGRQPEAAATEIKGIERVTTQIIGECALAPQASFWSSLKDGWKKIEAEIEAE